MKERQEKKGKSNEEKGRVRVPDILKTICAMAIIFGCSPELGKFLFLKT